MSTAEMKARYDQYLGWLGPQARVLARGEVPPTWRKDLQASEVDDMAVFSGGRVLVCTGQTGEHRRLMDYGPCLMLDGRTGRELWSHPRKPDQSAAYNILLREPVLVLSRAGRKDANVEAIDPASGRTLWQRAWPGAPEVTTDPTTGKLLVLEPAANHTSVLRLIDPQTGADAFATPVDAQSGQDRARLVLMLGRALVIGERTVSVSLPQGTVQWTAQSGRPTPGSTILELPGGDVVLATASSLVCLGTNGALRWRAALDGPARTLGRAKELIVAEVRAPKQWPKVFAIDARSGRRHWVKELVYTRHRTPFVAARDRIFFVADSYLHVLGADDGREVAKVELAWSTPPRITAQIKAYPDHIVLLQEGSATAFDFDGKLLWWGGATDPEHVPSSYARARGKLHEAASGAKYDAIAMTEAYDPFVDTPGFAAGAYNTTQLADERALVVRSTGPAAAGDHHEGAMARWSRELDADVRRIEQQMASGRGGTESLALTKSLQRHVAAASMIEASTDFMMSAQVMARQIYERRVDLAILESARELMPHRIRMAFRTGRPTGDFFGVVHESIEGLSGMGRRSLMIIDLRDGRWADVSLQPCAIYFNVLRVDDAFPAFDLDAGRVYVRGLGLDPRLWRQDVFPSGKAIFLPAPGLLAYEIGKLDFKPAEARLERRKVISGRMGEIPTIQPGRTSVAQLIQALGPPKEEAATEVRWLSVIEPPIFSFERFDKWVAWQGETFACQKNGTVVTSCATNTRSISLLTKDLPPEQRIDWNEAAARFSYKPKPAD